MEQAPVVHECTVPPRDDVVVRYIDSGSFVNTRRKIRRFLTVSDTSPRSKNYLRSSAAIRQEKARHLHHYYHMIHPFSNARALWEFFMCFVLLLLLIIIPIEISYFETVWYIKIPKLCLDVLCCIDVCITFASGYYQRHTKMIVLNPRKVMRHYLSTYFLVDVISAVPTDLIVSAMGFGQDYWFIKLTSCLKLLRLTTFIIYLDRIRDIRGYSIYNFKAFKLILMFFIALLWATSLVYIIARASKNPWFPSDTSAYKGLLISCFKALYNILLIGHGYYPSHNILDILFSILCLIIGVVVQVFIYAEILLMINKNLSSKNKYQHILHQLHEYCRYKQLPERIRKRIHVYFDFRFEKKYYKETEILTTLSENLRQDIIMHICQSLIESVDFFRDLPTALLIRIVKCMRSEIYLTNDVIVRAGIFGDSMYFIASGTIAVYTTTGKEICHLADGEHFGEIALVMDNEKRIANVVAVECCELFNLNRKDFQKAIGPYPELNRRIRQFAQQRLRRTMTYMDEEFLEQTQRNSGFMDKNMLSNLDIFF